MEGIRQYIMAVTAAGILCGVAISLCGGKGSGAGGIKLLAGLFLCVTVLSPWVKLRVQDVYSFREGISFDAAQAVAQGESLSKASLEKVIMEQVQSYILKKADRMSLAIQAEVTLDEHQIPYTVTLTGPASPSERREIYEFLQEDLDIPKERVVWN